MQYSPDGKALVYPYREKAVDNLWLQPVDGTAGHALTHFYIAADQGVSWDPAGGRFGVLRAQVEADVLLLKDEGGEKK